MVILKTVGATDTSI